MHYQSRNPSRERDHRISLMPAEPAGSAWPGGLAEMVLAAGAGLVVLGMIVWGVWG